ncbi:MAG: hypothetical protein ACRDJU_02485 [Actinomycetota bacterium]
MLVTTDVAITNWPVCGLLSKPQKLIVIWLSAEGGTGHPECQEAPRSAAVTGATFATKVAGASGGALGLNAALGVGDVLGTRDDGPGVGDVLAAGDVVRAALAAGDRLGAAVGGPTCLALADVDAQAAHTSARAARGRRGRRTAPR